MTDPVNDRIAAMIAQGCSGQDVAKAVGMSKSAVMRRARLHGLGKWHGNVKGSPRTTMHRPMPADFSTVATKRYVYEVKAHYACGHATLMRWYEEAGVAPRRSKPGKDQTPAPADLAEIAATMSQRDIGEREGVSRDVVARWLKLAGLEPRPRFQRTSAGLARRDYAPTKVLTTVESIARPAVTHGRKSNAPVDRHQRDMTLVGQAADYLRRFGPVYRCNDRGAQAQGGKFWRRGSAILTDAELIERAERNGWAADAWKRVA